MTFFKRKKIEGRRGYDIFGTFKYYVPGGSGIFWILIMFMLGGILGNIVTVALAALTGPEFAAEYGMLFSYPVMFIPLLVFASAASITRMPDAADVEGFHTYIERYQRLLEVERKAVEVL